MAQMTLEQKHTYMTQTPVQKLVCRLAVPTILSMLITSFYNMADTFFVGKLDTASVGAVGVAFSAMSIIQAIGFMFGTGSGNSMSRQLGGKNIGEAEKIAATGFFTSIVVGVLLTVLGLVFLNPLAVVLGSTDTILPHAKQYLSVILLAAPFYIGSIGINCQLRLQGSANIAMIGIVSGGIINLILDPVFIFAFDLGVLGAAIATAIGQLSSFVILLVVIIRGKNVKIRLRNFSPCADRYGKIFGGGAPSLCRQAIGSIAVMLLNIAAKPYGDAAIAGLTIASRFIMFASSALIGFGQGFQPVCAYNYGAKLYKRVRDSLRFCIKVSLVFLVIVTIIVLIFAPEIAALFRKGDPEVIDVAAKSLRWQMMIFPANAWIVMFSMMLQTEGKALTASLLGMCRQGIFFIPLILTLPHFFGISGIVMCQFWADVLTLIAALIVGVRAMRELYEPSADAPTGTGEVNAE